MFVALDKGSNRLCYQMVGTFFGIGLILGANSFAQAAPPRNSAPASMEKTFDPVLKCELLLKADIIEGEVKSAKVESLENLSEPYCRVEITRQVASGRPISVWYGLPMRGWNGRFLGTGGAAYGAGFSNFDNLASDGFMLGATDAGRNKRGWEAAFDGSFALDVDGHLDWPVIENFGHIAIHEMTVTGKELAEVYYGLVPKHAYFDGCSQGGRQGLMEAQRYPLDYDGIVAGAPAIFIPKMHVGTLWPQFIMANEGHVVDACKLNTATSSAIEACDGGDGLIDGLISNPEACRYDAGELIGSSSSNCGPFTEMDAKIVNSIWSGAKRENGEFLWYGLRRGASLTDFKGDDGVPLVAQPGPIVLGWVKYFLLQNPNWNWQRLSFPEYENLYDQSVREYTEVMSAENPDLTSFKAAGGKLLIWHGDADQAIPADGTIDYFNKVEATFGGADQVEDFLRLFMAPGVAHCEGGNGPMPQNLLSTLIDWVEKGKAPAQLLATNQDEAGRVQRSRPLCPHPQVAQFDGKGDPDKASSFSCALN